MSNFNMQQAIEKIENRIPNQNYALGKGLMQPFRNTNSGSRAVMYSTQIEQKLGLINPEVPIIQTGYEIEFGKKSSNYIVADSNYVVIDKIQKCYSDMSDMKKYVLILLDSATNTLHHIMRTGFTHISESYGYTYNNKNLDALNVGDFIPRGKVLQKTTSFDEYENRQDGLNLNTVYIASGSTIEDPIVISESAAKRFESPLFDEIQIMINDNDILLNLYGDPNDLTSYKTFPDIGEEIKDGILCAVRRKKKFEESLYSESLEQLKHIMISDEIYNVKGKIVDIDVYCNNYENLESITYNNQILKYYNINKEFCKAIVHAIKPLKDTGIKLDYETSKLYAYAKDVCNDVMYINEKVFNNIILNITCMRIIPLEIGDKITDRYGGKGVISNIIPDELMPKKLNSQGIWEPIDIQYNSSTCVNRENPGQLFETSITFIGEQLIDYIATSKTMTMDTAVNYIKTFLDILSPEQSAEFMDTYYSMIDDDDKYMFLRSIINDGNIYLILKPLTSGMCLDKIAQLYRAFPFIKQSKIMIVMKDSNGNIRHVPAHRPLVTGKKYIIRQKQYSEEKFSAVSLATSNIRGENTKNKAAKTHKIPYSTTPVKFGEMEWHDMLHVLNSDVIIKSLMMLSTSPMARRRYAEMLTGNPTAIDIHIDDKSTSIAAEIVKKYLRTIGLEIQITKIRKRQVSIITRPIIRYAPKQVIRVPIITHEGDKPHYTPIILRNLFTRSRR